MDHTRPSANSNALGLPPKTVDQVCWCIRWPMPSAFGIGYLGLSLVSFTTRNRLGYRRLSEHLCAKCQSETARSLPGRGRHPCRSAAPLPAPFLASHHFPPGGPESQHRNLIRNSALGFGFGVFGRRTCVMKLASASLLCCCAAVHMIWTGSWELRETSIPISNFHKWSKTPEQWAWVRQDVRPTGRVPYFLWQSVTDKTAERFAGLIQQCTLARHNRTSAFIPA